MITTIIGVPIFFITLAGVIGLLNGFSPPLWVPIVLTLASFIIFLHGIKKSSRLSFLNASTLWLGFLWIISYYFIESWGAGILTKMFTGTLLMATPLAAVSPYVVQKRFTAAAPGRKLELSRPASSPKPTYKEWFLNNLLRKSEFKKSESSAPEMIIFDLGEEVHYENK